jgi:hypothetical protein
MNNKTARLKTTATIAVILMMTSAALLATQVYAENEGGSPSGLAGGSVYPLPDGVTPDYTTTAYAYLSARPNPVGVGQSVLINIWVTPGVHVANYFAGFKVTITAPDGDEETKTMNSYAGDATAWFEYVPTQVGTYKFKFDFPGGYFPAGTYYINPGAAYSGGTNVTMTQSRWYTPSSTPVTEVVVQSDIVYSWPAATLPTDYWTRPVYMQNREWYPIMGNYPWSGSGEGWPDWPADTNYFAGNTKYTAWVLAPNSAHVVWRRQDAISGLIGAEAGIVYSTQSGAGAVPSGDTPSVIYAGRCYDTRTIYMANGSWVSCAVCYDLRTGEMYYAIPGGTSPSYVTYAASYSTIAGMAAVPGGEAGAGTIVELMTISNNRLLKIDPWTGSVATNVTAMSGTLIGQFVISLQTNNTAAGNRLINWTTAGTSSNFTSRVVENRSVSFSSIPSSTDWQAGIVASATTLQYNGAEYGVLITAYSLKTGQLLCNFTDNDHVPYTTATASVDHGKIAILMQDGYAVCYDLTTGQRAWVSQHTYDVGGYPWGIWGVYNSASYGGNYILSLYDGIYAFNWTTGKISWVYKDPSVPFETPYAGYNPFMSTVSIADGKIYTYNSEHTQSQPFTRGWKLHCINATTGEGVWNITGPMVPGPMADGYLTASSFDGYMYVFGKGKSATTVTAPDVVIAKGNGVVIKGTVLDQSPAQPDAPCVSEDSMSTQMEYLHMQYPIDGIWHNLTITGVPVTLTAIDSDGAFTNIGTVTTDGYYGTFEMAWTPPAEGTYKIIASFAGDDSYGSSGAATAVSVGPAPEQITIPEQVAPIDYTTTIVEAAIAIIVALVIAMAIAVVLVKKRA